MPECRQRSVCVSQACHRLAASELAISQSLLQRCKSMPLRRDIDVSQVIFLLLLDMLSHSSLIFRFVLCLFPRQHKPSIRQLHGVALEGNKKPTRSATGALWCRVCRWPLYSSCHANSTLVKGSLMLVSQHLCHSKAHMVEENRSIGKLIENRS